MGIYVPLLQWLQCLIRGPTVHGALHDAHARCRVRRGGAPEARPLSHLGQLLLRPALCVIQEVREHVVEQRHRLRLLREGVQHRKGFKLPVLDDPQHSPPRSHAPLHWHRIMRCTAEFVVRVFTGFCMHACSARPHQIHARRLLTHVLNRAPHTEHLCTACCCATGPAWLDAICYTCCPDSHMEHACMPKRTSRRASNSNIELCRRCRRGTARMWARMLSCEQSPCVAQHPY